MFAEDPFAARTVTRETRKNIIDVLAAEEIKWWGRLDEVAFLQRVWNVSEMPSTDYRFKSAAEDVHQHRVNNYDWDDDWIYGDTRFDVLGCVDDRFLAFLCEMVHPLVRDDVDEAERIVQWCNELLIANGWRLVPSKRIRGRPIYHAARADEPRNPAAAVALEAFARLDDPTVLRQHLDRIERDVDHDPDGAIGASKELVESVCRVILEDYGDRPKPATEVLDLYKAVAQHLKLNAEAVPDNAKGSQSAQRALRTLTTTVQSLAELRNELGTGHGRGRRSVTQPRHARLAFHAAWAVTEFLLATWHQRREADSP